ncbi:hypothetical protein [Hungatella sp.]|uniref:hypothetical protein n=1 Tax=Hungatella sp. TaxID=2613924 RepID=UPI002A837BF6|nr:hypothetical protein [Hungatella sp.]
MPYCPKCDMEFIKGVTVCSDCGGPLFESKEEALAMQKAALAKEPDALMQEDMDSEESGAMPKAEKPVRPPAAYVKKSQKYEDRKSSASAFLLVGGAITVFAVLCWAGIFDMPMAGFSKYLIQGTLTVMGIGCLVIAILTFRSAKGMASEIEEEEKQTEELISWFLSAYRREDIDGRLDADFSDLGEDERNLKRFELISDLLITSKDLPDQAYVDALCEEIYSKLFDE